MTDEHANLNDFLTPTSGEGAQWNNFASPGTIDDNFALLDAMVMLIVDSVLYMVVAWYVDHINPGEAGIAQPFYFPFMVGVVRTIYCKII